MGQLDLLPHSSMANLQDSVRGRGGGGGGGGGLSVRVSDARQHQPPLSGGICVGFLTVVAPAESAGPGGPGPAGEVGDVGDGDVLQRHLSLQV